MEYINIVFSFFVITALVIAIEAWYKRRDKSSRSLLIQVLILVLLNIWGYFDNKVFLHTSIAVMRGLKVIALILAIWVAVKIYMTVKKI